MTSLKELLGIDDSDPLSRLAGDLVDGDMRLIERLIEMRHKSGMTQADVAEALGRSQASVANFERLGNDPRLSTIRRYAMAIGARISHDVDSAAGFESPKVEISHEDHISNIKNHLAEKLHAEHKPKSAKNALTLPELIHAAERRPVTTWRRTNA